MFDWRLILANMPHWHHDRTQSLHDAMQISLTPPADMYPIVPDKVNLKISSHRISALHQFIIIFIKVAIWGVTYPVFRHDMSPKLPPRGRVELTRLLLGPKFLVLLGSAPRSCCFFNPYLFWIRPSRTFLLVKCQSLGSISKWNSRFCCLKRELMLLESVIFVATIRRSVWYQSLIFLVWLLMLLTFSIFSSEKIALWIWWKMRYLMVPPNPFFGHTHLD